MFKIISAELKKMVSKPGVYVLAVLLALILVMGVFIYEPTVYEDTSISQTGTFLERYQEYYGDGGISSGLKLQYDSLITYATSSVSAYNEDGTTEDKVTSAYSEFVDNYKAYKECSNNDADTNYIEYANTNLINSLKALNTAISNGINACADGSYLILTSNSNYKTYTSIYDALIKQFNVTATKTQIAEICYTYEQNYKTQFEETINSLIYPALSNEIIINYTSDDLSSRLSIQLNRLEEINAEIEALYDKYQQDSSLDDDGTLRNKLTTLINLYASSAKTYSNLVKNELLSNAFSFTSTREQLDLMYLSEESEYNTNSSLILYNYLFENNKTEDDYAHPLTIGVTSNHETNAYDYAYFILKLFSFILIIYAVMTMIHAISGEIKDGSMRYLAIRPVSRLNIIFGKFLAVCIMCVIMILFSAIIALLVGGAFYGFSSLTILTVFNGSSAITMHPLCMILIYLLSLFVEILVYLSIATLLACLLKSDLFAVTIMLVLYIINIILPIAFGGINSWLAFYPFSHISLYALLGSSIYALEDSVLNNMLGVKIFAGSNIWLTLIITLAIIVVCTIFSAKIFKKKEL